MTGYRSNLLLVGAQPDRYGASRMLFRMAAGFVQRGVRVTCALPGDGPVVQSLREADVDVRMEPDIAVLHRLSLRSPLGWVTLARKASRARVAFDRLCEDVRPDIVHTNTSVILPSAARAAAQYGAVRVQHVREFYDEFGLLWIGYRRMLLANADAVVCVSRAVADRFGGTPGRIEVVHDGFRQEDLTRASADEARAFRKRWGIPFDAPLVGIVGRIKSRRKGQDVFLRAAAVLASRFPAARFVIVGSPFQGNEADAANLRRLSRDLGVDPRVTWTGELTDTRAVYASMDVAVVAAVTPEPFGNTTLEAMAQARPVVGTATGGTPEQIENGVTGILVPPDAPEALAEALTSLLSDPVCRREMGLSGRQKVMREFGADRMVERILAIYERLLRRTGYAAR
jgi:glycosyltransferase involved in cell wall biosynthesis